MSIHSAEVEVPHIAMVVLWLVGNVIAIYRKLVN
jgi:hypothetical protein